MNRPKRFREVPGAGCASVRSEPKAWGLASHIDIRTDDGRIVRLGGAKEGKDNYTNLPVEE